MNDELRREVRLLKALQGTSYKKFAEAMGIAQSNFSNWLCGKYNFGEEKQKQLIGIILAIKRDCPEEIE